MSVDFFAQKIEDLTCLCSTLSRLAKKLDPRLKPSNLKELTYLTNFKHKSPYVHAVFLNFCTRVFHMPIPRPDLRFFFFAEKFWSKVGHTFQKILTDQKSDKKKTRQVRSLQWHIEDVRKISWSESKKRRGHSPRNKFVFFYVNQPAGVTSE